MSSLANKVARIRGVRIPWKGTMLIVITEYITCCSENILLTISYSYLVFRIYQHLWFFTGLKNRGEFTKRFLSHCQVKQSYLFLQIIHWIRSGISLHILRSGNWLNILNLFSHTWNVGSHSIKFKASSVSFPAAYT